MCGIFGVVSSGDSVIPTLLTGLQKLEYRGYDSSGIAIINNEGKIEVKKSEGKVERLCEVVDDSKMSHSTVGIAHTLAGLHMEFQALKMLTPFVQITLLLLITA